MVRLPLFAFLLSFLALPTVADEQPPAPLRVLHASPDDVMNAKFANTDGWIGADGIQSIPLPDQSVLWVFGDTLTGRIRDGKRVDLRMVNNSFARQTGSGQSTQVKLQLNRDPDGNPASYIVPKSKPGYFWLWDGIVEEGKLYLFTTRLTSPGTITAFDWKLLDQSLLVIENPLEPPNQWRIQQLDLPFGVFTDDYEAIWGLEVLKVDGQIYVYGTTREKVGTTRGLVVARVSPKDFTHFERWEFLRDNDWQHESRRTSWLTTEVGTEGSITWLPDRGRYVYVYSPPLDPNIKMRTATTPIGPWSEPVTIYTCPEAGWDPRIFCYAGKARLVPGSTTELMVSYATNSFEMESHVTADARVYFPRFVRVSLKK